MDDIVFKFQLFGKERRLSRSEVDEKLRHASPKPIDKYFVTLNGRVFPPKQVLAVALSVPLTSFTTTDANRILTHLDFEVKETSGESDSERTESEILFEQYLNNCGFRNYKFEQEHLGKRKKPDYSLPYDGGREIQFEIKEFRATKEDYRLGFGAYDPYGPIREKISEGRKKFQEFKDFCCCLVLYNREKPLVDLGWEYIYGAMLGNLGFRIPFDTTDPSSGLVIEETKPAFLRGGKMHAKYDAAGYPMEAANTTISAILVLGQFLVGRKRFDIEVHRKEKEMGRRLSFEEHWTMLERARGTERDVSLTTLRTVLHENPYAKNPFPKELFRGPYDERYGLSNGGIGCIFVGEEVKRLEQNSTSDGARSNV